MPARRRGLHPDGSERPRCRSIDSAMQAERGVTGVGLDVGLAKTRGPAGTCAERLDAECRRHIRSSLDARRGRPWTPAGTRSRSSGSSSFWNGRAVGLGVARRARYWLPFKLLCKDFSCHFRIRIIYFYVIIDLEVFDIKTNLCHKEHKSIINLIAHLSLNNTLS